MLTVAIIFGSICGLLGLAAGIRHHLGTKLEHLPGSEEIETAYDRAFGAPHVLPHKRRTPIAHRRAA